MSVTGQAAVLNEIGDLEEEPQYPLLPLFAQITALGRLPLGWNGYGAVPPSAASVATAVAWVAQTYKQTLDSEVPWYTPNVSAGAEGEVILEWWATSKLLNIYIDGDSVEYMKYRRNTDGSPREHGDARDVGVQKELLHWFSE